MARAEAAREGILAGLFRRYVRLIRFEPGRIEFSPADGAPGDLAQQLGARLEHWTGTRWAVVAGTGTGSPTLNEQAAEAEARRRAEAAADPLIAAALAAFPGATITAIRPRPANEPPGDEGS